jgi:hypothetical protein
MNEHGGDAVEVRRNDDAARPVAAPPHAPGFLSWRKVMLRQERRGVFTWPGYEVRKTTIGGLRPKTAFEIRRLDGQHVFEVKTGPVDRWTVADLVVARQVIAHAENRRAAAKPCDDCGACDACVEERKRQADKLAAQAEDADEARRELLRETRP